MFVELGKADRLAVRNYSLGTRMSCPKSSRSSPRDERVEAFPQLQSQKKLDCRNSHAKVFMSPDHQPEKQ